ncbi:aldehyde oxidase 1-like [Xiphias gladius]|uniref:aldehyde oxidase 1-like n=1 Tax=Xiphias gladius TaxID=8245 RepID=UPI001A9A05C2|nr:aldehyde oxidase 1-like [Xiphias gladius]
MMEMSHKSCTLQAKRTVFCLVQNICTDIMMDVGKSIDPTLDIGQVEGGFVGLYAILMTRGPSQYKVPALCDVPSELTVHQLADAENPRAIYLSKVLKKSLKKPRGH